MTGEREGEDPPFLLGGGGWAAASVRGSAADGGTSTGGAGPPPAPPPQPPLSPSLSGLAALEPGAASAAPLSGRLEGEAAAASASPHLPAPAPAHVQGTRLGSRPASDASACRRDAPGPRAASDAAAAAAAVMAELGQEVVQLVWGKKPGSHGLADTIFCRWAQGSSLLRPFAPLDPPPHHPRPYVFATRSPTPGAATATCFPEVRFLARTPAVSPMEPLA